MLTAETSTSLAYWVPLREKGPHSLPVDKLRLTLQVGQPRQILERGVIDVLSPFRVKVVAKIRAGELSMEWKTIDPAYPPVTTAERGRIAASVLFLKLGGSEDIERTDFKRVKPYSARFGVKIGPLKTLPL